MKNSFMKLEELPGKGLDWVNSYGLSGIETFSATGFPNPSWEYFAEIPNYQERNELLSSNERL